MLKILDQIPIWKTVKALPARIEALEKRIEALEGERADPPAAPGQPCPACGARTLRRTGRAPTTGVFADLGMFDEVWTCGSCGDVEHRTNVK